MVNLLLGYDVDTKHGVGRTTHNWDRLFSWDMGWGRWTFKSIGYKSYDN